MGGRGSYRAWLRIGRSFAYKRSSLSLDDHRCPARGVIYSAPQSEFYFEFPPVSTRQPLLLLQRFAVRVGPQSVHVVDLESEGLEVQTFPFPFEGCSLISTTRIGANRIARVRQQGTERQIDLFEISSDGDVILLKSWEVGTVSKPKPIGPPISFSEVNFHLWGDRIYSKSSSENKMEERSSNGELVSNLEVPSLDLSTANWNYRGNYIYWEGKEFNWLYFDLETRVFLKVPPTFFGEPNLIGNAKVSNGEWAILSGFTDSLSGPQIAIFDRNNGETVRNWTRKPYQNYKTIQVGGQTELLESGFQWGLNFTRQNLQDGCVIQQHFPLGSCYIWIEVLAASVIVWSIVWLCFSASCGGNAWLDIYLVSAILLGIGL